MVKAILDVDRARLARFKRRINTLEHQKKRMTVKIATLEEPITDLRWNFISEQAVSFIMVTLLLGVYLILLIKLF